MSGDKGDWWARMAIGAAFGMMIARVGGIIGHGIEPPVFQIVLFLCLGWCVFCTFRAIKSP